MDDVVLVVARDESGLVLRREDGMLRPLTGTVQAAQDPADVVDAILAEAGAGDEWSDLELVAESQIDGRALWVYEARGLRPSPDPAVTHLDRGAVRAALAQPQDPLVLLSLFRAAEASPPGPTAARKAWVTELPIEDGEGWSGLFAASAEIDGLRQAGPEDVPLDEALAWARARAPRVLLRVGSDHYSAGPEPSGTAPPWAGPPPVRRPG